MKPKWSQSLPGFLAPISQAFTLIYIGYLFRRIKIVAHGIRNDKATFWGITAMAMVGVVSAALAEDKPNAFAAMLAPLILMFIYSLGRWGIEDPRRFLKAVTLGSGFVGLVIVLARVLHADIWVGDIPVLAHFQRSWYRGNVLGMADNGLAAMLDMGVAGGIGFSLYVQRRRWLYVLAALFSLLGVFNTFSRGSTLGVVGAVLFLLASNSKALRRYWRHALALVVLLGLLVAAWPQLQQRLETVFDVKKQSQSARVLIWEGTLNMVKDRPIFGIGPGQFGRTFERYKPDALDTSYHSPHSLYLFILSGWGIAGFLVFYGWLATVFVIPLFKRKSVLNRIAFAMMLSFWLHVMVDDLFIAHVPLIMGCMVRDDLE